MRNSISPQILEWGIQEHVEGVVDRAFRRVLDRHHAEIGVTRLHFLEHLVDRAQRERPHRMAEVLEDGLLRESSFGSEEGDLERLLLGEAGGHDFPEQAQDFLAPQGALVALQHRTQDFGLPLRPIEIDRLALGILGQPDFLGQSGPLVQQLLEAFIHPIDLAANLLRFSRGASTGRRAVFLARVDAVDAGVLRATARGRKPSARREWRESARRPLPESDPRRRSACTQCRRGTC